MLINNSKPVRFISYKADRYSYCTGVLTLAINEKEYTFGYSFLEPKPDFDQFWSKLTTHPNEWIVDMLKIPEQFQQYAEDIDRVFNDNVGCYCCGGCE